VEEPQVLGATTAERAYQQLRAWILEGRLPPGERLVETRLAAWLGMSRTPVREAIRRLEQDGLVVTSPQRGACVFRPSVGEVRDIYDCREGLEGMASVLVSRRRPAEVLRRLEATLRSADRCFRAGDLSATVGENVAFHEELIAASDNQRLIGFLKTLRMPLMPYRAVNLLLRGRALLAEHEAIFAAVAAGDEEESWARMRAHIRHDRDSLLGYLEGVLAGVRPGAED
jgi:DNA-binding GntR family transcriptional regulator